jgi:prephenate dehydrogenase
LAKQKGQVARVGYDLDHKVARQAEKAGAVDKLARDAPGAVRGADMVVLALPVDQIRPTLEVIASELKEKAVVLDTALAKQSMETLARGLLPPNRPYVGLTPIINPVYLIERAAGIEAAHPDLFRKGNIVITAPLDTPVYALQTAIDLTRMVGAEHLFSEPLEVDSQMAATHLLPEILAAALTEATVQQPGWHDTGRLAGRVYAEMTDSMILCQPTALAEAALLNQPSITRLIDNLVFTLQTLRTDITDQNRAALAERFKRASQGRQAWWELRLTPPESSQSDMPTGGDIFGQMVGLGGRKLPRRKV